MATILFDSKMAGELSRKGWEIRRERQAELEKAECDLKALRSAVANSLPQLSSTESSKELENQWKEILIQMKTADADEKNKLSAAFDRLFKAWQVLSGTQNPGVRKGIRRQAAAPIAPIESPALPAAPVADPIQPTGPRSEDCTG